MVNLMKELRLLIHAVRRLLEVMIKLSVYKKNEIAPNKKTISQPYYKRYYNIFQSDYFNFIIWALL